MSLSCRIDVVLMTEEINILGTSKTKYKSQQRKYAVYQSRLSGMCFDGKNI